MKKHIMLIFSLALFFSSHGQQWIWYNLGSGSGQSLGEALALNPSGVIFCQGTTFCSQIDFGQLSLSTQGNFNTFIASYTSGGSLINASVSKCSSHSDQVASQAMHNTE